MKTVTHFQVLATATVFSDFKCFFTMLKPGLNNEGMRLNPTSLGANSIFEN